MTDTLHNDHAAAMPRSGKAGPQTRLAATSAATALVVGSLFLWPGSAAAQTQPQAQPQTHTKTQSKTLTPTRPSAAQTQNKGAKAEPSAAQPPKAASGPLASTALDSLFLEQARTANATSCASTYAKLGRNLTAGATFAIRTQAEDKKTGKGAIQGVIGMNYSNPNDYSGPAGGVVLAVPTEKGCEGNMVRIVPFPQSCAAAQAFLPAGSRPQAPLSGLDVVALPTGGQTMFIPAVSGCVVVSFGTF